MSLPVFFPQPIYRPSLPSDQDQALSDVCAQAGAPCRASGAWTRRPIRILRGPVFTIEAEPGYQGRVQITVPASYSNQRAARLALGALAYALFDGVARASIKNEAWRRAAAPVGRPKSPTALNGAERQKRWRDQRRAQALGPTP